jgi:hypothetical protein
MREANRAKFLRRKYPSQPQNPLFLVHLLSRLMVDTSFCSCCVWEDISETVIISQYRIANIFVTIRLTLLIFGLVIREGREKRTKLDEFSRRNCYHCSTIGG